MASRVTNGLCFQPPLEDSSQEESKTSCINTQPVNTRPCPGVEPGEHLTWCSQVYKGSVKTPISQMRKELRRDKEEGDRGCVWKSKSPGVQSGSILGGYSGSWQNASPLVLSLLIQGWGAGLNNIRKHFSYFSCSQHNARGFGKPLQPEEDALYIHLEPQFSPWGFSTPQRCPVVSPEMCWNVLESWQRDH